MIMIVQLLFIVIRTCSKWPRTLGAGARVAASSDESSHLAAVSSDERVHFSALRRIKFLFILTYFYERRAPALCIRMQYDNLVLQLYRTGLARAQRPGGDFVGRKIASLCTISDGETECSNATADRCSFDGLLARGSIFESEQQFGTAARIWRGGHTCACVRVVPN